MNVRVEVADRGATSLSQCRPISSRRSSATSRPPTAKRDGPRSTCASSGSVGRERRADRVARPGTWSSRVVVHADLGERPASRRRRRGTRPAATGGSASTARRAPRRCSARSKSACAGRPSSRFHTVTVGQLPLAQRRRDVLDRDAAQPSSPPARASLGVVVARRGRAAIEIGCMVAADDRRRQEPRVRGARRRGRGSTARSSGQRRSVSRSASTRSSHCQPPSAARRAATSSIACGGSALGRS